MSKVLILVERFWPEDFLVNDLASEWKRRGHDIEVLTQVPSYPLDRIFDGYENKRLQTTVELNGIPVHRVNTIFGYNSSVRRKVLNYLHFGWRTFWWAVRHGRKYDRVFVYHTAALTMAVAVLPLKILWRKPVTIWTQDLWPDAVYAYGFKPAWWKQVILNSFVRTIYGCCDRICVSCPSYVERIRELTGREAEFVPQWEPGEMGIVDSAGHKEAQGERRPFVFMFAGNLGVPQNLENDIEGFVRANLPDAELWLVGGGVMLESLKTKYASCGNVKFCGRQPRVEMPKWFAQADALIISLTEDYRLTLPGKFQSYIKTGKPLLGFISGATRDFIDGHQLGWSAEPGDVKGVSRAYVEAVEALRAGKGLKFGLRALQLSKTMFDRTDLIDRLWGLA